MPKDGDIIADVSRSSVRLSSDVNVSIPVCAYVCAGVLVNSEPTVNATTYECHTKYVVSDLSATTTWLM